MNSTGSGRPERLTGWVITTEAAAAIPDGVLAVEMVPATQRGQSGQLTYQFRAVNPRIPNKSKRSH